MTSLDHPTISIITPVWETDPDVLRQTIDSVRHQTYPWWELLLVDDGSRNPDTLDVLRHYAFLDPRVRVHLRGTNGGIVAASNDALARITGEFVALLDHDDLLHPDALGSVGHALHLEPDLDVLYTDEDKVDMVGNRFGAYHKPGWSPELLFGQMLLGHLTVYRGRVIVEAGGFRDGYMGSQDWDLSLRVTERTDRIRHIPRTLYHWRQVPGSTSLDVQAKPYTITAARKALQDALVRRGVRGHVEDSSIGGHFHVRRDLAEEPTVSVVLPTAGGSRVIGGERVRLVDRCVLGLLEQTTYDAWHAVVVLSDGTDPAVEDDLRALAGDRLSFVQRTGPFDFSAAVNLGVAHTSGEFLLLLNDDVEPITPDWLTRLVEWGTDPGIGAVGAKLLFEDGTVQHSGVVGYQGAPVHHLRQWDDGPGYFGELMLTKNVLAVTGACLLTRRAVFDEVGGFSPSFPVNFNDVDYCLKLVERGYRNVVENQAVLYHYESSTRPLTVTLQEASLFGEWWGGVAQNDPYFSSARSAVLPPPAPDMLGDLRTGSYR